MFAVLALSSPVAIPRPATAGAWTLPPGRYYARVVYASLESRTRFDSEGRKSGLEGPGLPARDTEYRSRVVRVYGEYGIASAFTAYGSLVHKEVRLREPLIILPQRILAEETHETSGVGDLYLGGRIPVLRGRIPASLATELKIPAGYDRRANPALGNGEVDATIRALIGASADAVYATADGAWTRRGGAYQDEAGFSFELGGRALGYYSWRGVLRGIRSLGPSATTTGSPLFDPALASPRALTIDGVVGGNVLNALYLEVGLSHVISGRNVLAGNTLEVGVALTGAGF